MFEHSISNITYSLLIKYHAFIPHKISHVHTLSKTTCYIFEHTKHLFYIYLLGKPTVKHYTYINTTMYITYNK